MHELLVFAAFWRGVGLLEFLAGIWLVAVQGADFVSDQLYGGITVVIAGARDLPLAARQHIAVVGPLVLLRFVGK
jgi:hypothetical protein